MPITTPNFSTSESLSSNNLVTFSDTSTGDDILLTSRRISILLANGKWLDTEGVESTTIVYHTWAIGDASVELNLLTRSISGTVTVDWLTGSTATYTKTIDCEWDLWDYVFLFGLLSAQTSYPARTSNSDYWQNSFKMITNLFQSEQAITLMSDIYSSQGALDRNYYMITRQNNFF